SPGLSADNHPPHSRFVQVRSPGTAGIQIGRSLAAQQKRAGHPRSRDTLSQTGRHWTSARLPDTIAPVRYDLRLTPDLATAKFDGNELIELDVFKPVSTIFLNAAELSVSGAALRSSRRAFPAMLGIQVIPHGAAEQVAIRLPRAIPPGRY